MLCNFKMFFENMTDKNQGKWLFQCSKYNNFMTTYAYFYAIQEHSTHKNKDFCVYLIKIAHLLSI